MKATILGSAMALALWGGAALGNEPEDVSPDYTDQAEEAREEAPTVYDDDATGGSGTEESVTEGGETWDTEEEPGGLEPQDDESTGGAGEEGMDPGFEEGFVPEPEVEQMEPEEPSTIIIEEDTDTYVETMEEEKRGPDATGVTVLLGGGVEGYSGDLAPRINAGPAWGVGVALKPTDALGLEFGYSGAVNSVERPGASVVGDADIVRNGGQAVATVGLPGAGFQPYLLGGIGIDRYNVRDARGEALQDDTVGNVPVGIGFRSHIGDFTADLRGQYGILFNQGFAPDEGPTDVDEGGTPTGRYGATLRLGATF